MTANQGDKLDCKPPINTQSLSDERFAFYWEPFEDSDLPSKHFLFKEWSKPQPKKWNLKDVFFLTLRAVEQCLLIIENLESKEKHQVADNHSDDLITQS